MSALSPRSNGLPMPARTTPSGTPSVRWPSERHLLRRLACRNCGSLVIVDDVPSATAQMVVVTCWMCSRVACELVHDGLRRMTPAEFHALPTKQTSRAAKDDIPCPDCKVVLIRPASARCRDCAASRREELALKWRLVALLEDGATHSLADLMARFGVPEKAIHGALSSIRRGGTRIVKADGLYRLVAER